MVESRGRSLSSLGASATPTRWRPSWGNLFSSQDAVNGIGISVYERSINIRNTEPLQKHEGQVGDCVQGTAALFELEGHDEMSRRQELSPYTHRAEEILKRFA